jgi:hypothetical protein
VVRHLLPELGRHLQLVRRRDAQGQHRELRVRVVEAVSAWIGLGAERLIGPGAHSPEPRVDEPAERVLHALEDLGALGRGPRRSQLGVGLDLLEHGSVGHEVDRHRIHFLERRAFHERQALLHHRVLEGHVALHQRVDLDRGIARWKVVSGGPAAGALHFPQEVVDPRVDGLVDGGPDVRPRRRDRGGRRRKEKAEKTLKRHPVTPLTGKGTHGQAPEAGGNLGRKM